MARNSGNQYEQKPEGHMVAVFAHLAAILAFPYFFVWTVQYWALLPSSIGSYVNYYLAAVPLAPLVSYLFYSSQRRKIDEHKEAAFGRFQTLQAVFYQLTLLALAFVIVPGWTLGDVPIGVILFIIGLAMVIYGVVGAVLILGGRFDFSYPGIGEVTRRIVDKRYEKR